MQKNKDREEFRSRCVYQCSVCDDIFDDPDLGHCPRCGHHYLAGAVCNNCYRHTIKKTMKRSGFTVKELICIWNESGQGIKKTGDTVREKYRD